MIIKNEFFDSMTGYLRMVEFHKQYVEFDLPVGFKIDVGQAQVYFEAEDVSLSFKRDKDTMVLSGRIKDKEIFKYILKRYYENGPEWGNG